MSMTQSKVVQIGGLVLLLGLAVGLAVWSLAGRGDKVESMGSTVNPAQDVPMNRANAQNLQNPYEENKGFIAEGEKIYENNCVNCHGPKGDLPKVHPFTQHSSHHSDGDYVWIVSYGIAGTPMAGQAKQLSLEERWQVLRYIRTAFPSPETHDHQ